MKVFIFGCGENGQMLYKYLKRSNYYEVEGFIDNNTLLNKHAIKPIEIKNYEFDKIIVSNSKRTQCYDIGKQLELLGLSSDKIDF